MNWCICMEWMPWIHVWIIFQNLPKKIGMLHVVMPRVNLIAILMTYVRYVCSINCPTVICLPSMLFFILWRDTTSELWTPVQFPFTLLLPFTITRSVYILAYYYLLPLDTLNPLFTANRWDWQPHRKLGQSSWLCCVQVPRCCWWRNSHVNYAPIFFWCHCPECRKASKHHLLKFGFLLLVR
jgi:hypothetical protein